MTLLLGSKNLSVRFFNQKKKVLDNISVSVQEGEKVLILGPSGCGKSTLLSVLAGIIPEHIEAEVSGEVTRKKQVGVMFQDPDAQFCMKHVNEEIAFSLENRKIPREKMDEEISKALKMVGLSIDPATPIQELSGGMKQRLALACLLALEPEVLFFDEPTAQIDPASRKEIFELLYETSKRTKQTMIFVEHVLDGCIEWMDRLILLDKNSHIIAEGIPAEILLSHKEEMEEAGIWRPKVYPFKWEEVVQNPLHTLNKELMHRYESRKLRAGCKKAEIESIIVKENATLAYKKTAILNNINGSILRGEWVAIVGKNGSGKSTFLKALANLIKLKSGDILIKGKSVSRWKDKDLYRMLGFVFQNPELQFINDTVFEEVAFSARQHDWKEEDIAAKTTMLLKEFGLAEYINLHPFMLSFGQKRRLSVATMLLLDQDILLLDEPTFGQDEKSANQLLRLLKRRQQEGTTIVMVTHDMDIVDQYADRVILFEDKQIAYNGHPYFFFRNKRGGMIPPLHYQLIEEQEDRYANEQSVLSISH
ncbi:ABC transporter ATP-binding protein [Niallia nealsonii]|uniref:ABC transporter n=1 Tax=Niallia nealsonii TaxID=115979 RepID=A0A2N0YZ35_9BACI|nr:ABC transporter ATP-binding protein [Niallia nealsonii]PKG22511.1 ABC transporter [Niallia nealsonii]